MINLALYLLNGADLLAVQPPVYSIREESLLVSTVDEFSGGFNSLKKKKPRELGDGGKGKCNSTCKDRGKRLY